MSLCSLKLSFVIIKILYIYLSCRYFSLASNLRREQYYSPNYFSEALQRGGVFFAFQFFPIPIALHHIVQSFKVGPDLWKGWCSHIDETEVTGRNEPVSLVICLLSLSQAMRTRTVQEKQTGGLTMPDQMPLFNCSQYTTEKSNHIIMTETQLSSMTQRRFIDEIKFEAHPMFWTDNPRSRGHVPFGELSRSAKLGRTWKVPLQPIELALAQGHRINHSSCRGRRLYIMCH